jgi:hypothetical protein
LPQAGTGLREGRKLLVALRRNVKLRAALKRYRGRLARAKLAVKALKRLGAAVVAGQPGGAAAQRRAAAADRAGGRAPKGSSSHFLTEPRFI